MIDFIFVSLVVAGALGATGLFLYGAWRLIRDISFAERLQELLHALGLTRADKNPILTSRTLPWEEGGVMNPGVVRAGGKTHLFYRAVGGDGVSRIGYAASDDGLQFLDRPPYPVFALRANGGAPARAFAEHSGLRESGGSYAGEGTEDPRAVIIDDRMYLSFNAFSDWGSLRIGLTSLSVEDLMKQRWKWTPPVYLSAPGEVHKSWVLFPEKLNNAFSVLHGFSADRQNAHIAHVDTLDEDPTPYLQSDASFRDHIDTNVWDSKLRGAATPPLRTKAGWLVFYHANDAREHHRYKLGAMLLDLADPSKVLGRSALPVLAPDTAYENDGKPGVVYACGATLEGDTLRVYYGGGDTCVCVATTSLKRLLKSLSRKDVSPLITPPLAYA